MEHLPPRRHTRCGPRQTRTRFTLSRTWRRLAMLAGAAVAVSLVLPAGAGAAAPARPQPDLKTLLARVRTMSDQINALNEQYDGLRIQMTQARDEEKIAERTFHRLATSLGSGEFSVGQLAAESYMNGGVDGSFQILTASDPQTLIDRAAFMQQLQRENGDRVGQLAAAEDAARRAQQTAQQQGERVKQLLSQMAAKRRQAEAKMRILNSAVYARAMQIFQQTGQYPPINVPGDTIGEQALRYALTRRGDPYVWGAAGPDAFDCSGLVMWAYARVGISLPHYTGAQWNMGIHVSQNDLQPGDLVFFYPTIEHVGLYIGNGLMVDAPDFGEPVQVQPVMWDVYVGAVRIVG